MSGGLLAAASDESSSKESFLPVYFVGECLSFPLWQHGSWTLHASLRWFIHSSMLRAVGGAELRSASAQTTPETLLRSLQYST